MHIKSTSKTLFEMLYHLFYRHAWLSLEAQKYKRRLESLIMGAVQINEGTDKVRNF